MCHVDNYFLSVNFNDNIILTTRQTKFAINRGNCLKLGINVLSKQTLVHQWEGQPGLVQSNLQYKQSQMQKIILIKN